MLARKRFGTLSFDALQTLRVKDDTYPKEQDQCSHLRCQCWARVDTAKRHTSSRRKWTWEWSVEALRTGQSYKSCADRADQTLKLSWKLLSHFWQTSRFSSTWPIFLPFPRRVTFRSIPTICHTIIHRATTTLRHFVGELMHNYVEYDLLDFGLVVFLSSSRILASRNGTWFSMSWAHNVAVTINWSQLKALPPHCAAIFDLPHIKMMQP